MTERSSNGTAYTFHGPEGRPVIALIHGLGLNRHTWDGHVSALSERYRVLNYDLFGHGESAPSPRPLSLTAFAGQLVALMDELHVPRCTAVGFSLGGMINRRLAIDRPDRVSALAILNSPHERGPALQRQVEERAASVADGGSEASVEAALERWFTEEFRTRRPDVMQMIRTWRAGNHAESYAQSCMVLAAGVKELIRPVPAIATPSLVMTCEHDTGSTPAMSHAIAGEIAGSKTIIVPGLRHMGLVEHPKWFTAPVLEFLDDVSG
jgi:pimeloyl-ACP methyl ester carboxylesterase